MTTIVTLVIEPAAGVKHSTVVEFDKITICWSISRLDRHPVIYEGPEYPDFIAAIERCRSAGISYELEQKDPAPGWTHRRLLILTPSGYRLALEGLSE
jgi:hypothetical protein